MPSALDTPLGDCLQRVNRFSGWCFSESGAPLRSVSVSVNGRPYQMLQPTIRSDLAAAFPDIPSAICGGFCGDVVLPQRMASERKLTLALTAHFADGSKAHVVERTFAVTEGPPVQPSRSRSYDLERLMEDPETGRREGLVPWLAEQDPFDPRRQILAGVPHFHPAGSLPLLRISEQGPTHPYGPHALALIGALPAEGVFLDLGCGIKPEECIYPNAVNLDAVHFRNVDVVSSCSRLPLRDGIFDLVISQAVFEHLPSPPEMAKEIFRVLKPGGKVLIDTAFMQPLHGDPSHFFNMTLEGLRLVLQDFEILEDGVQPYQLPSYGLRMQIETVMPFIKAGLWKKRLADLLNDLANTGWQLDQDLGPVGQNILAAGVFALARRPCRDRR